MKTANQHRFQELITQAQSAVFSGWNFDWLADRMIQEDPPWNYPELVRSYLVQAHSLLDMGTGGGEFLASLAPLPTDTHATEAYPPNQPIAERRLSPLGVQVHSITDLQGLPFDAARFDLVINRHEGYNPTEVYRVLKAGGVFITQQVGGLDNLELNQVLEETRSFPFFSWNLVDALTGLIEAGFSIINATQAALKTQFKDIGAIVYYLKAIPWQIEGFSLETHTDKLMRLHDTIEHQGGFISTAHRFLIIAHKKEKTS